MIHNKVILPFLLVVGASISSALLAKRAVPSTPQTELTQLRKQFREAVENKDWIKASQLVDHEEAWAFIDRDLSLEAALWNGELDLAKKIIQATRGGCGRKSKLIEGLKKDIERLKQSIATRQKELQNAQEILLLLEDANSMCI